MPMSVCSVGGTELLGVVLSCPLDWGVSIGFNPPFPYMHNGANFKHHLENNLPFVVWHQFSVFSTTPLSFSVNEALLW